jgi:hypothetical protein
MTRPRLARAGLALLAVTALVALSGANSPAAPAGATTARSRALVGTFALSPGRYANRRASGSYFRMIFPGGKRYFLNPDSRAGDQTFTLVRGGANGGLVTGRYQPASRPPFDRSGNSRAGAIIRPQAFAGIRFGLATVSSDPQSHRHAPAPSILVSGRRLVGYLQAITAEWNKQYFNQGAPKPGSSGPTVTGVYNARTHAFLLQWRSLIRRGPFNGFTGYWHLQGTFRPGR